MLALRDVFADVQGQLGSHASLCWKMATRTLGVPESDLPAGPEIRDLFTQNLEAQGASHDAFERRVTEVMTSPKFPVRAPSRGYLRIHLEGLRDVIGNFQKIVRSDMEFSDPCGIILLKQSGDLIEEGEPIAMVRFSGDVPPTWKHLRNHFRVENLSKWNTGRLH